MSPLYLEYLVFVWEGMNKTSENSSQGLYEASIDPNEQIKTLLLYIITQNYICLSQATL